MTKAEEKALAIATAKEELTRLCPRNATIFVIERGRSSSGVTVDAYVFRPSPGGIMEDYWLCGWIAEADIYRMDKKEHLRIGGIGYDHSETLVSRLAEFLYGDRDALCHRDLH